jgi:uncharacterized protein
MSSDESKSFPFERPDPDLMRYYVFCALLTLVGAPFVLLPLWCRYATLRYKIDEDGISMKWGVLMRREIYVTYRRIQDIHVTRNLLERWMGLAKISLQTASGSSQAELIIEGTKQPEALRDFLYGRMRGARNEGPLKAGDATAVPPASSSGALQVGNSSNDIVLNTLIDIRESLRELVRKQGEQG